MFLRNLPMLVASCALLAANVSAQTVRSLQPDRYVVIPGRSLELSVEALSPARVVNLRPVRRTEWDAERLRWLFVRARGSQENVHELTPRREGATSVPVALPHSGLNLIGLDLAPRVVELPASELTRFLRERVGIEQPGVGTEPTVSVRRIESMKLLVRVMDEGDVPSLSATAQSKSGQGGEIRPLADPTALRGKTDLPVRVYLPGSTAGVTVTATHEPTGKTTSFVTRPGGIGHFRVNAPGVWTVEAHAARAALAGSGADWELFTATLRFDVPFEAQETEEEGR